MAKIDLEKVLIALLDSPFNKQFDDKVKNALKEQGLEYKDGEIVEIPKPKFKVGDWIINRTDATIMQIINNTDFYESIEIGGQRRTDTYNYVEWDFRLWTIEDAKEGDVLIDKSNGKECPFIFKETKPSNIKTDVLNPLSVLGYCGIGGAGFTKGSGWGDTANCIYYPATKEQRAILFQKMKEAGYELDADKLELKKIEPNNPCARIYFADFNGGEGYYKLSLDNLNKKQVEAIEALVASRNKK